MKKMEQNRMQKLSMLSREILNEMTDLHEESQNVSDLSPRERKFIYRVLQESVTLFTSIQNLSTKDTIMKINKDKPRLSKESIT